MDTIAGIAVPETDLAAVTTAFVGAATDRMLYDHCRRVFFFGMLKARHRGLDVDPETAYVGALFHDLGLTERHRRTDQRFELDGADAAREFVREHGGSARQAEDVWLAIALDTTPEIPLRLALEVAVVTLGVEADVLGKELDQIDPADRDAVVSAHPRPEFKKRIVRAFYDGMKDRPETTFGTMNDDVLAHCDPAFRRTDFVELSEGNDWPE